ncbi:MAG TPA: outer membrane lipoprotein-sorting protein [Candidatus Krumholzibacteria bacterium]|nr:outer membrane lipoprotein-sorting protein [Candidatus Krumholzibacteria bacterium]
MKGSIATTLLIAGLALSAFAPAARAQAPDAEALMKEAHLNMYYAGNDGSAHVKMTITDKNGKTRDRDFVILRKDFAEGGEQRYYVYFFEPNDVRRTTFMAWKNPDGDDSRWIYIPSLDLVKALSANDKKSSFVGSDFAYEDVSGRHWSDDTHKFLREEEKAGYQTWVIESTPKSSDYFARKVTWIDKASKLVVREEYFDSKDEPLKTLEVLKIETADGHPTAVERRMTTPRKNNNTLIVFSDVAYDQGIGEDIFTERYLKSPPQQYINQ